MKPLECMQIPVVYLPHELHFKRSRLFNFDLTSMEQTNDMFFPSMTSRYMEVGETSLGCMQIPEVSLTHELIQSLHYKR